MNDEGRSSSRKRFTGAPPGVAWKTGTSYGHRDAWAAGWLGPLTAVVWMGNVDNSPPVSLVGAEAAGPLLFDVLEAAQDKAKPSLPPRVPADLAYVEVCAYSGQLATDACPETTHVLALKRAVPTQRCLYHQALDVDLDSGQALTPACRAGNRSERRTYVVWPSQVRRILSEQDRLLPEPPPISPGCQEGGERKAPRIVSPAAGQIAMLLRGVPASEQEIPLEAEVAVPTTLSWFVDGKFVGAAPAVLDRVGVEDLQPPSRAGQADPVAMPRDGREVAAQDERVQRPDSGEGAHDRGCRSG